MEKIKLKYPVVVEGRYDKNTLSQIFDGVVIPTSGFGIFNSKEKQALIRRLGDCGIILLTDSDGGGKQIRSFLRGILPPEKVFNAYIPKIVGKERRKSAPSKEGYLGVEGMTRDILVRALSPFIVYDNETAENNAKPEEMLTKVDFYLDNLTGHSNSVEKRQRLCQYFGLPRDMTANSLLEALNLISSREEYRRAVDSLFTNEAP
jgi:ribonuclease M5